LRYAASERTALVSVAMRALPSLARGTTPAAGAPVARGAALPPLPEGPRRSQADVLVITIDALRADHVGAYGYGRATTPNIDALRRVDQLLEYYDTVKPARSFVWVHFFEPHEPYVPHPGFAFGNGDVDRYDGEIAYTDAAVGRLIHEVRARRPGTIIIVAAD